MGSTPLKISNVVESTNAGSGKENLMLSNVCDQSRELVRVLT